MGGLLEPCITFVGNCSAHGDNNSKWFGKCAFKLKKDAVVRKLLHRKVGKVPKSGCWGCRDVMWKWRAPNPAPKCMQLLGEHHCISFRLLMQRKDESLDACRFWAPAKCTPTLSQKFHSGAVCALQVARPQSCTKMHATAWRASLHHISTSHAKKRWKFGRLPLLSTRSNLRKPESSRVRNPMPIFVIGFLGFLPLSVCLGFRGLGFRV
jgi:hypothetical protein